MSTPTAYTVSLQAFDAAGALIGQATRSVAAEHMDVTRLTALMQMCVPPTSAPLPPAGHLTINEHAHGDDHHS